MISEKFKRPNAKNESSNEQFRCGGIRSNEETGVMAVE